MYNVSVNHQHNLDHTDHKFITLLLVLSSWFNGRLVDLKIYSFCGQRLESCVKHSFFQKYFLLGVFLHLKVSGFRSSKVCVDDQHSHAAPAQVGWQLPAGGGVGPPLEFPRPSNFAKFCPLEG